VSEQVGHREKREARPARPAVTTDVPSKTVDELWLGVLQRLCAKTAHEIRGALNGVSVNVEVVRARAGQPNAPASSVGRFADVAADQLGTVMSLTESVLSLARAGTEPVELAPIVRRVADLLVPAIRVDGRRLELMEPLDLLGATTAPVNAARLAIGAALLSAAEHASCVECRVEAAGDQRMQVSAADGGAFTVDESVVRALAGAGVVVRPESSRLSISFPRSSPTPTSSRSSPGR